MRLKQYWGLLFAVLLVPMSGAKAEWREAISEHFVVVSAGSVDRTMGAVFDDLAASDRAIAAAMAVRVGLIDEVRVLSEIGAQLGYRVSKIAVR